MIHQLHIQEFLSLSKEHLTLDVRSEGEYDYGHVPHAINLPLFNNEERKIVGTAYKQQCRNDAMMLGLEIVGKKMAELVKFAQPKVKGNKIFIHCWRGGMRSGSMAWLFNLFGYEVYVLKGGYKAYRHEVLDWLGKNFHFIILGGRTGSGKTEVLQKLKNLGEQVIDLENLANHKGSAFGSLGLPPQPSTEHFENLLVEELKKFDLNKCIWLEDESKTIGKVFLDLNFWRNMCSSPLFVIELPLQIRLERLVADYGEQHLKGLEESVTKIKRRLGNEQWKNAIEALHAKNFTQVAKITLYYYDKAYDKGLTMKDNREIYRLQFEENNTSSIAKTLIAEVNKKYGI